MESLQNLRKCLNSIGLQNVDNFLHNECCNFAKIPFKSFIILFITLKINFEFLNYTIHHTKNRIYKMQGMPFMFLTSTFYR